MNFYKRFNQYDPLAERLEAKIMREPNSGCWLWTGSVRADDRPVIKVNGRPQSAYRVMYELMVGPIPEGMHCCHRCDVSSCVNPGHIFLGTARDNAQDALAKGRLFAQKNPAVAIERGRKLGKSNTWTLGNYRAGKLTLEQREQAIERHKRGESYASIAKDFGVTKVWIYSIYKRHAALAMAKGEA